MKVFSKIRLGTAFFVHSLVLLAAIPVILIFVALRFPDARPIIGPIGEMLLVTVLAVEGLVAISELTHSQLSSSKEQRERAAQIANTFFSNDFRNVRRTAWKLSRSIVRDRRFAKALAMRWIMDVRNDDVEIQTALDEGSTPFSQIIEFYLFVFSYYRELDEVADHEFRRVLDKYRYPFWRGSIILARDACERIYVDVVNPHPLYSAQFPRPSIVEEITELDSRYSSIPYSLEHHPMDNEKIRQRLLAAGP